MSVRRWAVEVTYLVGEHVDAGDDVETTEHIIAAPTAQAALRALVMTSTENGRVTRIHVEEVR